MTGESPGEADADAVRVRPAPSSRMDADPAHVTVARGVLAQRQVLIDGTPTDASLDSLGHGRHRLRESDAPTLVILEPPAMVDRVTTREVIVDGFRFVIEVEPDRLAALRELAARGRGAAGHVGPTQVRAVIPGKVGVVSVAVGDVVVAGQQLLVIEAMKMQNELRAPRGGTIERVGVAPGANIDVGDILVVISEEQP